MSGDDEIEASLALDDDNAIEVLTPFYDLRPPRQAWRNDPEDAPLSKPVFARELASVRVIIAMRDEEGWVCIRRDGQISGIEAVATWAPLAAALT